jgi:hypothetical protein
MLLHEADEPIALWQYAERYLGVGTRTYSSFAADLEISPRYHPLLGAPGFTLPTFRVPAELGGYLANGLPSDLHALYRDEQGFLLPVHPDALEVVDRAGLAQCPPGPPLEAVPSANARTVFVTRIGGAPVRPHFVKLHYPRRLSRFTRRLRRPVIELQLWVAAELRRAGLPVMPEVGGGWIGASPAEAWGFLVRELDLGVGTTVPLFALYGRDHHRPGDPTLLEQLVDRSDVAPMTFVSERIVQPMVRMWVQAALRTGCPLETHGQNTLFSFGPDATQTRIMYRDSAIYVDAALRQSLGLSGLLPPTNVIPRDVRMPADEVFSLTYDSFMGHHALSYVAELARQRFGVDPNELHRAARTAFAEEGGGRLGLPAATYYYDDTLYDDGDWKLVDTARPPVWR